MNQLLWQFTIQSQSLRAAPTNVRFQRKLPSALVRANRRQRVPILVIEGEFCAARTRTSTLTVASKPFSQATASFAEDQLQQRAYAVLSQELLAAAESRSSFLTKLFIFL